MPSNAPRPMPHAQALKDFVKSTGLKKAVLGLSGGIDSAVTLKIAVDALGPGNVTVLIMPELGLSSQENIEHAKKLAGFFKVNHYYQPINSFLVSFSFVPWGQNETAQMNLRARIRMTLLYNYANAENALVLGTSNKSELILGYGTKFGDLAADVEVIGSLYKTEVIALAKEMGLPQELIEKKPTAELARGQTDEEELGATYDKLDQIIKLYEEGLDESKITARGLDSALVQKTIRRINQNDHKSKMPHALCPIPQDTPSLIPEDEGIIDEISDDPIIEKEEPTGSECPMPHASCPMPQDQQSLF